MIACYDFLRHTFNPKSIKRSPDVHKSYYERVVPTLYAEKPAIRVTVTGAAGQIGYALLPSIANGHMFGPNQKVIIQGLDLDIPAVKENLAGIKMELEDAHYPLLEDVIFTADPQTAFKDADYAVLLGAFPRKQGMERKDLMMKNVSIFKAMGEAINTAAKATCKVLVVGNPANTNALICSKYASRLPKSNFSALTRLDHNRAKAQIALKAKVQVAQVDNVFIWGNHSSTQYPDVNHGTVSGVPIKKSLSGQENWLKGDFISTIQKRGAAIINARKASSALSAARAVTEHIRDLHLGSDGKVVSMAVFTDGSDSYDIEKGIMYSFPVRCFGNGDYKIVNGLFIDDFSKAKMKTTEAELVEERTLAMQIVG